MTRRIEIGLIVTAVLAVPVLALALLFLGMFFGMSETEPSPIPRREISLPDHGTLIIDGKRVGRSEHGFSQRAGYRPPASADIEWFGDVSDGVEPQIYLTGPLFVVIDAPSACLFVRNSTHHEKWKSLALVFPHDLGPFPVSFYAEKTGLTPEEIMRIDELGGKRERKYPTTYIQNFDPATRDLHCSYEVDNKSAWKLHLRLSDDGTHLALIAIGTSP